ncbi:acid phosphatase type 7-like [Acanthaster planci]|uniref:Purple acid phosphatase n=1 Tax=Acanthaster planci TaxID=133434 RepID=A0A8B7ZCJ5_ACAPL|nr:acid phosphatase type 7-like [Acanthaster planci]XP_022103393.1 acid phosphatase type 7-like [Acanthaster planci]XP_022103394.1 acid phosphatase type 7-like [Acanthaster planci]
MDHKHILSLVFILVFHVHVIFKIVVAPAAATKDDQGLARQAPEATDQKMASIPEQIHIALGDNTSEMVVLWSTHDQSSSVVQYGLSPDDLNLKASGDYVEFNWLDGNAEGLQFIHRVKLTNLLPATNYSYRVHSDGQESSTFTFATLPDTTNWSPTLLIFGDMGYVGGAPSLRLLNQAATKRSADVIIHVGDFAYDFHNEGGKVGDAFMNRIQHVASTIPYMTCPGNHEIPHGFSHYRYRFAMPSLPWPMPEDKMWYSFNIARAHFVSYSSEVYFTDGPVAEQYDWLLKDLEEANKPENRQQRPWIIVFGHRPMYCSNSNNDDCTHKGSRVKDGLEELFFSQGVDVIVQGHEHSYERLWPVYKEQVYAENYTNPKAPVHIIGGAAGCNDWYGSCLDPILYPRGPWSAFRSWLPGLYGIGKLIIHNATHIQWQQLLAINGQVMDDVWIEQHHHGKFTTQ